MDPCVKSILCALAGPVRNAFAGLITGQVAALQVQLTTLQATLVVLDVALLPAQAAYAAAQAVLGQVQSAANLVPLQLMAGCADLGDVMVGLNASLDAASVEATITLQSATRQLALRDEVAARIDAIRLTIDQLEEVLLEIGSCP